MFGKHLIGAIPRHWWSPPPRRTIATIYHRRLRLADQLFLAILTVGRKAAISSNRPSRRATAAPDRLRHK